MEKKEKIGEIQMKIQRRLNLMAVIMVLLIGPLTVLNTMEAAEKKTVKLNKKVFTLTIGETSKLKVKNLPKRR